MNETIGNLEEIKEKDMAVYCDDRMAFIENLNHIEVSSPVKMEAFLVILCLKGRASLYINGCNFDIAANDLIICHPDIIMEKSTTSLDVDYRGICVSKEYMRQLSLVDGVNPWEAKMFLEDSPVLPLTPQEVTVFCQYYDLIRSKLTGTPRRHQKELIDALLLAFLYDFRDMLERFIKFRPQNYTSGNKLFRDFLELLSSTYPKPRNVAYYADKLCLTPKYLSTVCREACGSTASEIINRYVVRDVQYLLRQRGKSIKEICNELEFPNLSFFGRYVKKHLGLSPKAYRSHEAEQSGDALG